jgi:hypothetical protein
MAIPVEESHAILDFIHFTLPLYPGEISVFFISFSRLQDVLENVTLISVSWTTSFEFFTPQSGKDFNGRRYQFHTFLLVTSNEHANSSTNDILRCPEASVEVAI